MIKLAKLNEKHLTELTQVIYYGDMENSPDWKLLELNGALQAAIEEGQVLCFKGINLVQSNHPFVSLILRLLSFHKVA